jgi:7,8-dihydroneopterin aldolase/epimerase/oxygenase
LASSRREATVPEAHSLSGKGDGRRLVRAEEVGKVFINDLVVRGIIGVNDSERESPQEIVINLGLFTDLRRAGASDDIADCIDYQLMAEKVRAHAASARRFTVEALADDIAQIALGEPGVERVVVRVEKFGAVRSCRSVGVEIERVRGH